MNGVVMLVAVLVTLVALKQIIDRDWMGLLLTETAAGSLRIHSDGGMRQTSLFQSICCPRWKACVFPPPVLRYFHEHEILHHQSSDHHRRSRPPSAAQEFQLRLQPSERRHGWWMGSCSDTWSAPFLQGLGVAFRVQLPPEGAQTQTRALIQFRGEATF